MARLRMHMVTLLKKNMPVVGLAVAAGLLGQMAFRPITLAMIATPLKFVTALPAADISLRPAYSANLVFTSATSFEMVPVAGTKAAATGAYTVSDHVAHLSLRFTGLEPDTEYAVRCETSGIAAIVGDAPCSLKKPVVASDWKGRAFWAVDRAPFEDGEDGTGTLVTVARIDKESLVPAAPELSYAVTSPRR